MGAVKIESEITRSHPEKCYEMLFDGDTWATRTDTVKDSSPTLSFRFFTLCAAVVSSYPHKHTDGPVLARRSPRITELAAAVGLTSSALIGR
jgi:hypothetical protein